MKVGHPEIRRRQGRATAMPLQHSRAEGNYEGELGTIKEVIFLLSVVSSQILQVLRMPKLCMASKQGNTLQAQNHHGLLTGKHWEVLQPTTCPAPTGNGLRSWSRDLAYKEKTIPGAEL